MERAAEIKWESLVSYLHLFKPCLPSLESLSDGRCQYVFPGGGGGPKGRQPENLLAGLCLNSLRQFLLIALEYSG